MPVRLVVAEDSYLIRESLERLLDDYEDLEVAATCEDLPSLREAVRSLDPDVVLTDIRMPPGNSDEGLQIAEELRDSGSRTGILVLSQYADPRYALRLLGGGSESRGYLLKERVSGAALVGAIAIAARRAEVLPGWLTTAGYVVAALCVVSIVLFPVGPALAALWLVPVSVAMLRGDSRQRTAEPETLVTSGARS